MTMCRLWFLVYKNAPLFTTKWIISVSVRYSVVYHVDNYFDSVLKKLLKNFLWGNVGNMKNFL